MKSWATVISEPPGETENIRAERLISDNKRLAWRSAKGDVPPFIFIFGLTRDSRIILFRFFNSSNEASLPGISAREIEVEISTVGPDSGYSRAGLFRLEKGNSPQDFEITRSSAKWVRLTIHTNYGHPHFTELGEFAALGNFHFHPELLISYFIWIVGTAIILAAFGWHLHLARRENLSLRDALRLPTFRNPAKLGVVLIAAGALASAVGESVRVPVLIALGMTGVILVAILSLRSGR